MTKEAEPRREWGRTVLRAFLIVCAFVAMVLFSAVLARLTLSPSAASEGVATANLRPGASLRQYAQDYTFLAACKQVGGNLLLGVPFGVLLPVLVPRSLRLVRVMVLTVLVMTLVELAQGAIVTGRAFDVDDVIINTTGALIGYVLLGRRLGRAGRRRRGEPQGAADSAAQGPADAEQSTRSAKRTKPAKFAKLAKPAKSAKPVAASAGWGPGGLFRWRRRPVRPRP
ncbi:VanZ family protein [Streptomyces sp. NPDC006283]|uniref:VanZ family protein n=1 Tax=Streptomyces sp. NPDC006283 TaxID=3156741 RepID=UPI0033AD32EC